MFFPIKGSEEIRVQEKTALLLDEDVEHRQQIMEILTAKGYMVKVYSNPISFMLRREDLFCPANGHCFDLVLVSNNLSGMCGIEFLRRTKERGCILPDHRKAIFCSAMSQELLQMVKDLGCRVFKKPVLKEEIERWIVGQ